MSVKGFLTALQPFLNFSIFKHSRLIWTLAPCLSPGFKRFSKFRTLVNNTTLRLVVVWAQLAYTNSPYGSCQALATTEHENKQKGKNRKIFVVRSLRVFSQRSKENITIQRYVISVLFQCQDDVFNHMGRFWKSRRTTLSPGSNEGLYFKSVNFDVLMSRPSHFNFPGSLQHEVQSQQGRVSA